MSEARLADALLRLEANRSLRLPLRSTDLFGRLAMRLLWRRMVKWQVETNLATRDAVVALRDRLDAQQSAVDHSADADRIRDDLEDLRRNDQNMMAGLNQRLYSAIGGIRTELSDLRLRLTDGTDEAAGVADRLSALERRIDELVSAARDTRLRHAQLDLFLDQMRITRAAGATEVPSAAAPPRADHLELVVAELLDGPPERLRAELDRFLPVVRDARAGGATGPVFDLSPARGEWLDLLRSAEIPVKAASTNTFVTKHHAELGHPVESAEPLAALAELPRHSLGAVTAFRYAERLDPADLARFVDLAARALQPGGVLIVRTPTGTGRDFHLDPFAGRPVHPAFLRFLAEAAGFADVAIRYPGEGYAGAWPTEPGPTADRYCLLARL
jgi:hypothetical protein